MVNVCGLAVYGLAGLASGSILAYRLRGGEGDRGDLHWLDSQGWGKEARGLGGALGPVPVTVYYNTFPAAWLEIGGAVMGPRTWAPSRQPSWRWAGTTVT